MLSKVELEAKASDCIILVIAFLASLSYGMYVCYPCIPCTWTGIDTGGMPLLCQVRQSPEQFPFPSRSFLGGVAVCFAFAVDMLVHLERTCRGVRRTTKPNRIADVLFPPYICTSPITPLTRDHKNVSVLRALNPS